MVPDNYLKDIGETLLTAEAHKGDTGSAKGTLACTSDRIVYLRGDAITDISLSGVFAVECERESIRSDFLTVAILAGSFGIGLAILGIAIGEIPFDQIFPISLVFIFGGVLAAIIGAVLRRVSLMIHTPAKSFEFTGRDSDLQKFPQTVRRAQ